MDVAHIADLLCSVSAITPWLLSLTLLYFLLTAYQD
ncbi:Hypothetical protein LUCI_0450 [Lucifera butyrica]|uniref:Uncharacterized protein n=1 Tax=Lucifera butyrica TaxID=1351585 RepID=A0A498R4X9_9FIRM|nr:Hypothetical protein LUCI_0450 [Lucifera butyrica]